MIITPDFTEAVESTPIPAGIYNVRVTGVETKTSQKGAKYLNWKMNIFGAEGEAAKQNNRALFMITMLEGPGAGRLKEFAKAALDELPTTWDTDQFMGREVQVTVAQRIMPDGTVSNFPDVKAVSKLN